MTVRVNKYCCNQLAARFIWVVLCVFAMPVAGKAAVYLQNENPDFSTISEQTTNNTPEFLNKSKVEIASYFERVIAVSSNNIVFKRSKPRIIVDLTDIVNYYLNVYCSEYEIEFGGFSESIKEQVLHLDNPVDLNIETTPVEDLETRLTNLQLDLNNELTIFMDLMFEEDETLSEEPIKYLPLYPIDTPVLYKLDESNVSAADPFTGSPLLKDNDLTERIVQLLEGNNQLIELLSAQLLQLNEEMLEIKKEGLEYQREFSDIHQRIDGLENAINDIRSSNINISSNPNVKPIANQKVSSVFFDKNSIAITSEYVSILNEVTGALISNKNLRVIVTGYADKSGNATLNNEISQLRAQSVSNYLMKKGVSKNQILQNFLGDSQSDKESKSDRKVVIEWLTK